MTITQHDVEAGTDRERAVWRVLENVMDPEIPVLSIVELGIVRYAHWAADERLHVGLTPTYSGCPATHVIRRSVREALDAAGYGDALLEEVLSPPWTSEWLTESGRRKLESFGHQARLITPQFVKPFVKGNKTDFGDAQAICETASRPSMRFVAIKTPEQQTLLALHRVREALVHTEQADAALATREPRVRPDTDQHRDRADEQHDRGGLRGRIDGGHDGRRRHGRDGRGLAPRSRRRKRWPLEAVRILETGLHGPAPSAAGVPG